MSEIKTNKISPRKGTTQTIGDSGDSVSIPCGVTVTNAGTITTAGISGGTINNSGGTLPSIAGVIEWDTTAKTTGFTAVSNKGYFCNTTSSAFTVTLPASPTAGDVIALKDYANTFDTNNLTLNPNGNKIQGATSNFIVSVEGASSQFIYVDSTRGWVLTDASKASDISENLIVATGGTVTTCGNYKIHTFTSPGTFCVSNAGTGSVDYIVIAGGAGGGRRVGGGGGAGGFRESHCSTTSGCYTASPLATSTSLPITATGYPITVGAGGGGSTCIYSKGSPGSTSTFSTITSTGGGGGGSPITCNGANGGSGGGGTAASGTQSFTGGTGNTPPVSPPQGSSGGNGAAPYYAAGAGGGGATAVGANRQPADGGNGGIGSTTSISGTSTAYAGGGGGGGSCSIADKGFGGVNPGGSPSAPQATRYGAGNGGYPGVSGVCGTANTGGGGGGGGYSSGDGNPGGSGGSGIVVIRYKYQ